MWRLQSAGNSQLTALLLYLKYSAVSITQGSSKRWRIERPAEVFFLNQLAWDLMQALGKSFDLKA